MTEPNDRQEILKRARNLKMARSAHAYVRGNTVKFYEWRESSHRTTGRPFGQDLRRLSRRRSWADAMGRVSVQIRDLHQTVIGNPAHDLVWLGLSLASAACEFVKWRLREMPCSGPTKTRGWD